MWISMLNYEVGEILIDEIDSKYENDEGDVDINDYFADKHINPNAIDYMITEEETSIYDHHLQTYLDIKL